MSWERENYVVGTRSCRGNEILSRGNEIIMSWERDHMSWERDNYVVGTR